MRKRKRKRSLAIVLAITLMAALSVAFGGPARAAPCVTSAGDGTCGPYPSPDIYNDNGLPWVIQDVWNPSANWYQTLTANSNSDWSVAANMAAGNQAVVSYPDTQITLTLPPGVTPPLTQFGTSLVSTYAQGDPSGVGQDYEWAYDLWLSPQGTGAWQNDTEFMIWTDNHGQTPGGQDTGITYQSPDGTQYELWLRGPSSNSSAYGTITLVRVGNAQSGSVDIDAAMNWLERNGYVNSGTSFDQIDYGLEIASTGGATLTYPLTGFTLIVNGTGPGPTPTPTTPSPTPTSTLLPPPTNLSQTALVYVNFGWLPVDGAAGYDFQLTLADGTLITDWHVTGPHVPAIAVTRHVSYDWRVRAVGGSWSDWVAFRVP